MWGAPGSGQSGWNTCTQAEFTFRTYCRLHGSYAETALKEVIETNRRGTWTINTQTVHVKTTENHMSGYATSCNQVSTSLFDDFQLIYVMVKIALVMIAKVRSFPRAFEVQAFVPARRTLQWVTGSALPTAGVLTLAVALALATAVTSVCAVAQSLPDKRVVKEWVANARKSTELSSYAGSPYHFVAHFHYDFNGKSVDGMYEVLWAAPDRFRVEFRAGTIGETDVVLGGKKYVLRNTPTMSYYMWSISGVTVGRLLVPQSPLDHNDDSLHKLRSEPSGSTQQICSDVGDDSVIVHQMCFDAANGAIVADHVYKHPGSNIAGQSLSIDRTDYMQLGDTRLPRRVNRRWGPETIDITVDKWEAVDQFGADTFVPPAKSVSWDWCASPAFDTRGMGGPSAPEIVRPSVGSGDVKVVYFASYRIVGADGRIEQSTPLFDTPGKPLAGDSVHDRAPIHACDGKPIRYESISIYWPGLIVLGR